MGHTSLRQIGISLCLLASALSAQNPPLVNPPDAPKHPVSDTYEAKQVVDDYRWLEDWQDPAVKQWSGAENTRTRDYLDHIPSRSAIRERLAQLGGTGSASYSDLQYRGGLLFAMKYPPGLEQDMLVVIRSADEPEGAKVIFDPNTASPNASLSVDFFVAVSRRQVRGGGGVGQWFGRRLRSHFRGRDGERAPRNRATRQLRHCRRKHCLERQCVRLLLHAVSSGNGAAAGRRKLLPAGLLSRTRNRHKTGYLRHR